MCDLTFENHATIVLMRPNTDRGGAWIDEHIADDRMEWNGAVVVEHRDVGDILVVAMDDGLHVEFSTWNNTTRSTQGDAFHLRALASATAPASVIRSDDNGNPTSCPLGRRK
jgi:hypothetical protein